MQRIDTLQLFWLLVLTAGVGFAFVFAAELDAINQDRLMGQNEDLRLEIERLRAEIDRQ